MKVQNTEIFRLHAEFCKALANPTRLMIVELLEQREMSVGELSSRIGISLATASQHLRILRGRHVVVSRKHGQSVYYELADPRLPDACNLIRKILLDGMKERGAIATEVQSDDDAGDG